MKRYYLINLNTGELKVVHVKEGDDLDSRYISSSGGWYQLTWEQFLPYKMVAEHYSGKPLNIGL
jgi:hypothetical protein